MSLSNKETAKKLHISANTVDNHTNHLMTELNIRDRVGLTRLAIREVLVSASRSRSPLSPVPGGLKNLTQP